MGERERKLHEQRTDTQNDEARKLRFHEGVKRVFVCAPKIFSHTINLAKWSFSSLESNFFPTKLWLLSWNESELDLRWKFSYWFLYLLMKGCFMYEHTSIFLKKDRNHHVRCDYIFEKLPTCSKRSFNRISIVLLMYGLMLKSRKKENKSFGSLYLTNRRL